MVSRLKKILTHIRLGFALLVCTIVSTTAYGQIMTDSIFFEQSRPVIFQVNRTDISKNDSIWIVDSLLPQLNAIGIDGVIWGRASTSPEGPWDNNVRLADNRRKAATAYLSSHGFDVSRIKFDAVPEDYEYVLMLMLKANDPDYSKVRSTFDRYRTDYPLLKRQMQQLEGGRIWNRMLKEFFPQTRAVRILATDKVSAGIIKPIKSALDLSVHVNTNAYIDTPPLHLGIYNEQEVTDDMQRREVLSLKTNLLLYALYVPKYGWCPIPNVAIEYYPRHGHMTLGASFDCPWWIGNTTNHKYFELRNYTLEARYYTRNSNKSYYPGSQIPNGKAAFKGFYMSAYAHAFLYQIGCNKDDGWIGEGIGAGLGLGYVIPLGKRNQHWRLELGAQFGIFRTKYDPFVYGCPVENIEDGLYYYDYKGDPDLFKERQYRFTWLGPTRAGITLTYDLFYRRINRKGASFKHMEKGGAR